MKHISKTVWILSLVSLFTDMASEMLYPVMPLFLQQIGYSAIFIGFLEGIAEAVAGLTKSYFGRLSDLSAKRAPFIRIGYGLSAISKPMLAIFTFPLWVFLSRAIDRLGKGIRTGARDAVLNEEATGSTKATVFGFHRSMDTLGAVFGPTIALVYLYFNPGDYRILFLLAFLPGIAAVLSSFFIKDEVKPSRRDAERPSLFSFIHYWKQSSPQYRVLLKGLLLFAIVNSSDVFLLLKMKESGISDTIILLLYIFYNAVFAFFAFPLGRLADRVGIRKMMLFGLLVFVAVYTGFAINTHLYGYVALFALYGLYAASTEGISKAWISHIIDKKDSALAMGTYAGFQSLAALLASVTCGVIWSVAGSGPSFLFTAFITLIVIIYLRKSAWEIPFQEKTI